MYKLTRVLAALAAAFREAYAKPVEHIEASAPPPAPKVEEVVVPPPERELSEAELAYYQPAPPVPQDDNIQSTGQEELFSVYVGEACWAILIEQSNFVLNNVSKNSLVTLGAGREYQMFQEWLARNKPKYWLTRTDFKYNVYRVASAPVLEIYGHDWDELERYYCTLLDLPQGYFTLLDYMWRDPEEDQEPIKRRKQHALDHSAKRGKQ